MLEINNHQELETKTTMNYHLLPIRAAIIKPKQKISVGKDVEKLEPCAFLLGM